MHACTRRLYLARGYHHNNNQKQYRTEQQIDERCLRIDVNLNNVLYYGFAYVHWICFHVKIDVCE